MVDLSTSIGITPHTAAYAAPTPAPAPAVPGASQGVPRVGAANGSTAPPTPAASPASGATPAATAAAARQAQGGAATATGKPEKSDITAGFNPSVTIDPDTHIMVMTIRAPDGETLRQMPNQHELAAYKASAAEQKKCV